MSWLSECQVRARVVRTDLSVSGYLSKPPSALNRGLLRRCSRVEPFRAPPIVAPIQPITALLARIITRQEHGILEELHVMLTSLHVGTPLID